MIKTIITKEGIHLKARNCIYCHQVFYARSQGKRVCYDSLCVEESRRSNPWNKKTKYSEHNLEMQRASTNYSLRHDEDRFVFRKIVIAS